MPPQQDDNATQAKPRKAVRRDPEKRRQQNIQAQKKYRAKLRQRLDQLDGLTSMVVQGSDAVSDSNSPTQAISKNLAVCDHAHLATSQECSLPDVWLEGFPPASNAGCSFPELNDISLTPSMWDAALDAPDQSISLPAVPVSVRTTCSGRGTRDTTLAIDPRLIVRVKHDYDAGHDIRWTTTIGCGCRTPHFQVQTKGPDQFRFEEIRLIRFTSLPPLNKVSTEFMMEADPYANNLRIETICTLSALVDLGLHVGLTEEMICAEDSLSPFYRFSMTEFTDHEYNRVKTVQQIFRTLKPDLRPNREQITIKHHPQIDILPFPTLRRNYIINQDRIDEDEFFQDVLSGLVCWGGAGPASRRDRAENTGYISSGTPWDVRSWEAKEWFLRKYWGILGEEEGELVRQSEWWRGIRGDAPLDRANFC